MKLYKKFIEGKEVIKQSQDIVIRKNGKQIINPSEKLILEDGWVEYVYVVPERTEEEKLNDAKKALKNNINHFDQSEIVNIFYIGPVRMWLDKATRAGLMLRFQAEQMAGKEETTLWYKDMQFQLPLDKAFNMLYAIEVYASACYDNTQRHLAEADKLTTVEEVNNYNYHTGYPDVLRFKLDF